MLSHTVVSPGCPSPLLALWREINLSQVRLLRCVLVAPQLGTLGWAGRALHSRSD